MDRRTFLQTGLAAGTAASLGLDSTSPAGAAGSRASPGKHTFKLKYAPHFGMFRHHGGDDLIDQMKFMADQGFTALEDNGMVGRPKEVQSGIAAQMSRLGMTMGVFVAYGIGEFGKKTFVTSDKSVRDMLVKQMKTKQTKRCLKQSLVVLVKLKLQIKEGKCEKTFLNNQMLPGLLTL